MIVSPQSSEKSSFGRVLLLFLLCIIASTLNAKGKDPPIKQLPHSAFQNYSVSEQSKDKSNTSAKKFRFAVVTASALNLRSGPGTNNSVLKVLLKGMHLLTLSSLNSKWVKVRIPHSIHGWVAQKHIRFYQPETLPSSNEKYITTAFRSLLEASILQYMNEVYVQKKLKRKDKLSIVVQDLTTGSIVVAIRPRTSVKSASTIKVPILHAYMIQRFSGNITDSLSNKKMLEEMIRFSNNPSTNYIIELLGGTEKIQQLLNQTKIYKELSLIEKIPEDGRSYLNKISAADLNKIFVKIWNQRVIGPEYSQQKNRTASKEMLYLLGLPGQAWLKDRIKAGTCFSSNKLVKIWDKTGFVKGVNGNAGIVEIDTPHGRKAYSIVMFIEREDYQSITGDAAQWSESVSHHMRRISEMTYAFISNRYGSFNKCGLSRLIRSAKLALAPRPLQATL